jgi:hypothetical protein
LPLLLKFDIANINGSVCITDIRAKLFYNHAQIKNGAVQSLKFIDYTQLKANPELLANDNPAQLEFQELTYFAETFLLKGNLERFLVKEEGE